MNKQLEINDWTHANGVHFVSADTAGLFGLVYIFNIFLLLMQCHVNCSAAFNDFGAKFTCVDPTGEQPLTGMVVQIEKVTMPGHVNAAHDSRPSTGQGSDGYMS